MKRPPPARKPVARRRHGRLPETEPVASSRAAKSCEVGTGQAGGPVGRLVSGFVGLPCGLRRLPGWPEQRGGGGGVAGAAAWALLCLCLSGRLAGTVPVEIVMNTDTSACYVVG